MYNSISVKNLFRPQTLSHKSDIFYSHEGVFRGRRVECCRFGVDEEGVGPPYLVENLTAQNQFLLS